MKPGACFGDDAAALSTDPRFHRDRRACCGSPVLINRRRVFRRLLQAAVSREPPLLNLGCVWLYSPVPLT